MRIPSSSTHHGWLRKQHTGKTERNNNTNRKKRRNNSVSTAIALLCVAATLCHPSSLTPGSGWLGTPQHHSSRGGQRGRGASGRLFCILSSPIRLRSSEGLQPGRAAGETGVTAGWFLQLPTTPSDQEGRKDGGREEGRKEGAPPLPLHPDHPGKKKQQNVSSKFWLQQGNVKVEERFWAPKYACTHNNALPCYCYATTI